MDTDFGVLEEVDPDHLGVSNPTLAALSNRRRASIDEGDGVVDLGMCHSGTCFTLASSNPPSAGTASWAPGQGGIVASSSFRSASAEARN